jgi:hypothetical protein
MNNTEKVTSDFDVDLVQLDSLLNVANDFTIKLISIILFKSYIE